uniref:Caspase recruitment domain-containing protein 19 n=1 Tax=Callithrix jacchus TaxID=9483 RepID=A0A2R8NDY1_CALJA
MTDQTYCDRLVQDTPFLTGHGRLSEQQVDRIILQLNRYYPQILTNKEAEKFRNPKASLRVRLCDLLSHLQQSGERDCQEFYRALYIHAQPLHSRLPSRHALQNSDCTELDSGSQSGELSDRGPMSFLAGLGLAVGLALLLYCYPPGGCRWTLTGQACLPSATKPGPHTLPNSGPLGLSVPQCPHLCSGIVSPGRAHEKWDMRRPPASAAPATLGNQRIMMTPSGRRVQPGLLVLEGPATPVTLATPLTLSHVGPLSRSRAPGPWVSTSHRLMQGACQPPLLAPGLTSPVSPFL